MKKEDNKVKCADDKREWRPLSSYRGGHALFRIVDETTEFGEFVISGNIAPRFRGIDEIWLNITEYLVDDFGNDLSWSGEVRFWQPYPKKLKRGEVMSKEGRQIKWHNRKGYYNKQELFFITKGDKFYLYFLANGREVLITEYTTVKSAKRGAERFLRRLQEAMK